MLAHVSLPFGAVGSDPWSVAVLVLVWGVATLAVLAAILGRTARFRATTVPFALWSAAVAAGLSLGAAAIHFAAIEAHFAEYPPYGIAFAALAWFQVGWAIARLFIPGRAVAGLGLVVNLGALLTWAGSRTVGLPFGPEPGEAEPIGPLDLVASSLEIGLIALLAWDLRAVPGRLRPALTGAGALVVLGSSTLAVVLMTTTAFAVTGGDPHDGTTHGGAGHGAMPSTIASPSTDPAAPSPGDPGPSGSLPPSRPPVADVSSSGSGGLPSPSAPLSPATAAASSASPSASIARPSRQPTASPPRSTPAAATATATPARTAPPDGVPAGAIRFGIAIDGDGQIIGPTSQFREGQAAAWIAHFREPPGTTTIRLLIVQVLADGREFEHWREDVLVADQAAERLVGHADLSVYLHGGDGSYRLRYVRGDELLAEGAFEFVR